MGKILRLEEREGGAKVIVGESAALTGRAYVDIRQLKMFVATKFGSRSLIGRVMLVEADFVPAAEAVGKIGTWLAILREDSGC